MNSIADLLFRRIFQVRRGIMLCACLFTWMAAALGQTVSTNAGETFDRARHGDTNENSADGEYRLGLSYLEGKVVPVDEARALELIRAAADQGHQDAMSELAGLYARGIGEPRNDLDQPMQLLQRAGNWHDLMFRYEYGLGTERDLTAAAQCYCRLALSGKTMLSLYGKTEFTPHRRAMGTRLMGSPDGHVGITGPLRPSDAEGGSDDVLRALARLLKAAEGDGPSALQIADAYLTGRDAPKSAYHAWAWLHIAATNGATETQAKIASLESGMTADELKHAREFLADLVAQLKSVALSVRGYPVGQPSPEHQ